MRVKIRVFLIKENAKLLKINDLAFLSVRLIGLEPTRRETPDPKSGASTNSATSALKRFMYDSKVLMALLSNVVQR